MLYPSRFLFTILINPVLLCFYPQIFLKNPFLRIQSLYSLGWAGLVRW